MAARTRRRRAGRPDRGDEEDRSYSDEEREFLVAIDRFRTVKGRRPTWAEVLAIAGALGWRREPGR